MGWLLWTAALATPWLVPTHAPPWSTFYAEWLMAVVLLPVGFWAAVRAARWELDAAAACMAALALVPLVQAGAGQFTFAPESWLIALTVGGAALAVVVARAGERIAPGQLIDALFDGLVVAAVASTALALYQWLNLDALGLMVWSTPPGGRPVANVGQPNNLSTLLVWGILGIWRLRVRGRIGAFASLAAASFLLFGVALTQSRTGWVAVAMCGVVGLLARHKLAPGRSWVAIIGLLAWFGLLVLALGAGGHALMPGAALSIDQQVSVGKRPQIWAFALEAIGRAPWLGYGWLQGVRAQLELAPQFASLQTTVQYAHNLLLDLALWQGVPITLAVVGGSALWCYRLRRLTSPPQWMLWLALAVLLVHAMLELPHAHAYFLLPAAIMVGTLAEQGGSRALVSVPRWVSAVLVVGATLALALVFVDYRRIEDDAMTRALREARIGRLDMPEPPRIHLLKGLDEGLRHVRVKPRRGMTAAELREMRRALDRYPSVNALLRYAQANVLAGDPAQATWAWERLCAMHPAAMCRAAAQDWATAAIEFTELATFAVPPAGVSLAPEPAAAAPQRR